MWVGLEEEKEIFCAKETTVRLNFINELYLFCIIYVHILESEYFLKRGS